MKYRFCFDISFLSSIFVLSKIYVHLLHHWELIPAILLKILTFRSSFNVLLEERIYSKLRNRIHFSLWILPRVESRQEVIQGRVHSNTYRINPDDEEGEE